MEYSKDLIFDYSELKRRVLKFQKELKKENIDYAIILQNADLFYFTGLIQQGILLLSSNGICNYFIKKNYDFAKDNSNFSKIIPIKNNKDILPYLKSNSVVGFELDVVPHSIVEYYKKLISPSKIVNISELIRKTKSIKSEIELHFIKEAANQLKIMCNNLKNIIKEDMTEKEIFANIQYILTINDHQGFMRMRGFNQEMFYGHVLSKPNSNVATYLDAPTNGTGIYPSFPQGYSNNKLSRGDIVSVDIVGCYNGYHADQTRPFAIGYIKDVYNKFFNIALEIQNEVVNIIKPGEIWEKAYFKAIEIAKKYNVDTMFMGDKFKVKFVGHGVGVEIDEYPFLAAGFKEEFKKNMVFAIEPKFFIPNVGVVGIENTFVIKDNGCEKITTEEDKIIRVD